MHATSAPGLRFPSIARRLRRSFLRRLCDEALEIGQAIT